MIGKIIGGTFKITMKALYRIPFIGKPFVNSLLFLFENLGKAIRRLPYVIGGIFVLWIALGLFGVV